MNKVVSAVGVTLALFASQATQAADAVNVSAGIHGIALEYYKAFSPKLNARFVLSDMPVDYDVEIDDIDYDFDYDRTNLGMLFDYRPLAGTFHLTTGLYVGDHDWNLTASGNAEYEVGDETYTSNDMKLETRVSFAKAAPYFGFGWGNSTTDGGFTANLDIGVMYTGKPSVNAEASGTAQDSNSNTIADVSQDPTFQSELEKERAEIEDEVEDYRFLPVIQLGLGYKF